MFLGKGPYIAVLYLHMTRQWVETGRGEVYICTGPHDSTRQWVELGGAKWAGVVDKQGECGYRGSSHLGTENLDDDDELMLNVLRCHLTY